MDDTTFLLLIGTVSILWWACVWGLFDTFVSLTKRPVLCYSIGLVVLVVFLYKNPQVADRLI